MAPHGGQAQDTPLALRRVKRLGKRLGPERAVGHLALRYGARQALLRAFSNAKIEAVKKGYSRPTQAGNAATTIAPAQIAPEDRAAVWRYLSAQTHLAAESRFWLCLNPLSQLELCRHAVLCRAPRGDADALAPARGGRADAVYVVLNGAATVTPDPNAGLELVPVSEDVVEDARDADRAMLEGELTRPLPLTSDTRPSAHAFGSLAVPEDVEVELRDACSEANILAAFLRRELRRAAKYGLVEDPSAPKKSETPTESAEPAEGAFLTDGMPPDGELVNVPPPSSPGRGRDDDASDDGRGAEENTFFSGGSGNAPRIPTAPVYDDEQPVHDPEGASLAMTASEVSFEEAEARRLADEAEERERLRVEMDEEDALNDDDRVLAEEVLARLDVFAKNGKLSHAEINAALIGNQGSGPSHGAYRDDASLTSEVSALRTGLDDGSLAGSLEDSSLVGAFNDGGSLVGSLDDDGSLASMPPLGGGEWDDGSVHVEDYDDG